MLVDGCAKQADMWRMTQNSQCLRIGFAAADLFHAAPVFFPVENIAPAKFEIVRTVRPDFLCNFIELCGQPMRLPFKNCNSSKNNMRVRRVLKRA